MVTVVPPRLAARNDPVKPVPPMDALSGVKAGSVFTHVIVLLVTVMLPAIVNSPKRGDADNVAQLAATINATITSVPVLLPRIKVVSSSLLVPECSRH